MSMFCFQCQEAAKNEGCTLRGVCGKTADTAGYQDLLIYSLKGLAGLLLSLKEMPSEGYNELRDRTAQFCSHALFATITNANFDNTRILSLIEEGLSLRKLLVKAGAVFNHNAAEWNDNKEAWLMKSASIGILQETNEDIRSLKELILYGLKGIAAYADHALVLGYENSEIWDFMLESLAATLTDRDPNSLLERVLQTGEIAVTTMATLDKANTETYGTPEITEVDLGVRNNPGILISGHDLKDMEELLKQTEGTGVDVYTHSEMLPAHYYPAFKQYSHFAGNYGNAWWKQDKEFETFNGPILMTTNCITPVKESYKNRIFTTGMAGYPGVPHIPEAEEGMVKDYSSLISLAKTCDAPREIETGKIIGGFAHHQVLALADKVVEAVKSGAVKRFVVMAGCDGRQKGRSYFTDVAENLPNNTIILTAGCAKYRYNKLNLGDIGGIPRVLDAGQCNDSYSLALIALKLKEVFELEDINDLPISFDIAWYEQKAVTVLLALLHLGVKGIRLGPTLPAFLSPGVAKILVKNFDIKPIGEVESDIEAIMMGK